MSIHLLRANSLGLGLLPFGPPAELDKDHKAHTRFYAFLHIGSRLSATANRAFIKAVMAKPSLLDLCDEGGVQGHPRRAGHHAGA